MSTTAQTLRLYWQVATQFPIRLTTIFITWPVGHILQQLILPLIAAEAINRLATLQTSGITDNYWHEFTPYLVAFAIVGACSQMLITSTLLLIAKVQVLGRKVLEIKVYKHLLEQSMRFHGDSFSGSLVAQATRFATGFVGIVEILMIQGIQVITKTVVATIIIAFYSPLIAGAIALWTICFVAFNIYLTKRRIHLSKIAAKADSKLTAHLADSVSNIAAIKSFATEQTEEKEYEVKAKDRAIKKYAAWARAVKSHIITASLMLLLQFGILVLSIYGVMNGSIQIGTLLLIQVYLAHIVNTLWGLSTMTKTLEQHFSDAAEMTKLLLSDTEVTDPPKPQKVAITKGRIAFDNISFTHGKKEDALFNNFTLTIAAGERIGLVGHSGSGKTTLTRLLLRFNDLDGGAITIDGQDISKVRQSELRKHIAYVPQEPVLFHRSLRENIAYGKPNATDAEIRAATKKAFADEFITKLPEGYDTLVGERGVKLSGGQRQRIAIARAILKDAPILVLDEATSALDSESETLIQKALEKLMKGRTTIVIAHRLSTIQKMDRVIVLHDGHIIEEGSHRSLIRKKGTYAALWKHQSGGFLEEQEGIS